MKTNHTMTTFQYTLRRWRDDRLLYEGHVKAENMTDAGNRIIKRQKLETVYQNMAGFHMLIHPKRGGVRLHIQWATDTQPSHNH